MLMSKSAHARDFWRRPRGPFTEAVIAAAARHAAEQAPKESCGIVAGGEYIRCRNWSKRPTERFKLSVREIERKRAGRPLEGVIHSHPAGAASPSGSDMRGQLATGVPWAIVSGEGLRCAWGLENPPLFDARGDHIPREFLHGASDCYTIIRDWWFEQGVTLPEFARERAWWTDPETHGSLYLDNLAEAGFRILTTDVSAMLRLAEPGDVALRAVRSVVPNHGSVVLPGGLMLDQRVAALSRRDLAARLLPTSTHLLRHESRS